LAIPSFGIIHGWDLSNFVEFVAGFLAGGIGWPALFLKGFYFRQDGEVRENSGHHPGRIIFSPPSRQERQVFRAEKNLSSLVFLGGLAVQK
jgi:hypothetical protein